MLGLEVHDPIRLEKNEHLFQVLIFMELHGSFYNELLQVRLKILPETGYEPEKGF